MQRTPKVISSVIHFLIALFTLGAIPWSGSAQQAEEFSKPVIDFGVVVKDVEKSAQFYTNAIGFREVAGFTVAPDFVKKIGLSGTIRDPQVKVRMFALGEGNAATKLKLLCFPETPGKAADQSTINAIYGIRYLTLYVSSADRALERLKKAGVATLGETPVKLDGGARLIVIKDPDGNFVELIGP